MKIDPNARIIRELRQEVEMLREMLLHATGSVAVSVDLCVPVSVCSTVWFAYYFIILIIISY